MTKAVLALTLALSAPVGAQEPQEFKEADDDTFEQDIAAYLQQVQQGDEDADAGEVFHLAQWGRRTWTCFAMSRRTGRVFSGQSRDRSTARRIAMHRCANRSTSCSLRNCR